MVTEYKSSVPAPWRFKFFQRPLDFINPWVHSWVGSASTVNFWPVYPAEGNRQVYYKYAPVGNYPPPSIALGGYAPLGNYPSPYIAHRGYALVRNSHIHPEPMGVPTVTSFFLWDIYLRSPSHHDATTTRRTQNSAEAFAAFMPQIITHDRSRHKNDAEIDRVLWMRHKNNKHLHLDFRMSWSNPIQAIKWPFI